VNPLARDSDVTGEDNGAVVAGETRIPDDQSAPQLSRRLYTNFFRQRCAF